MNNDLLVARIIAKTNEYLDFPSVVGHETPFLDHLARDFRSIGCSVHRERNLAVIDTGRPGPIFCAHIDRHGAVVDTDGRARFAAYAVKSEKYGETPTPSAEFAIRLDQRFRGESVFAYDRRTGGRLAYGEITAVTLEPETHRLLFEISGFPPLPGQTPIAFARATAKETDSSVSGQLDNPLSAAMLRVLCENGLRGRIVFAAEEEIGRSAAHILGWFSRDVGDWRKTIVVDTTPFDDSAALDAGAVILRNRDANATFDEVLTARLTALNHAARVPVIFKDVHIDAENVHARAEGRAEKGYGITELGRIITLSGGAVTGSTVQIPTVNYHTNHETTSRQALINSARLLLAASQSL